MAPRTTRTLVAERIHSSVIVVPETRCWEWQKARLKSGYGRITIGSRTDGSRRTTYAHRASYEEFVGVIPDDLTIDHLCRNRSCVNPEHLEAVTIHTNILRGDGVAAMNARKTECPQGHPYDDRNTMVFQTMSGLGRRCHACRYPNPALSVA